MRLSWAVSMTVAFAAAVVTSGVQALPALVYPQHLVDECKRMRTPFLIQTPTRIHLLARCCGWTHCSSDVPPQSAEDGEWPVNLGDDDISTRVLIASSSDNGATWGDFRFLENHTAYTNAAGVYDRMLVQFQWVPGGVTTRVGNTTYYQVVSVDDGVTWSPPLNITDRIAGCNPDPKNLMMQSAGNKAQGPDGRIFFVGHSTGGHTCVWYTDDGGVTYNTTAPLKGNEISIVTFQNRPNVVYMNGRGDGFSWAPNRTDYWSTDNGATWASPTPSVLRDPSDGGCERSLIQDALSNGTLLAKVLYSFEPVHDDRHEMTLQCSRDGGTTWPHRRVIDDGRKGGYSDLVALPTMDSKTDTRELLLVWEHPGGNFNSDIVGTEWCVG